MAKRNSLFLPIALLVVVIAIFALSDTGGSLVFANNHDRSIVDKATGDEFKVKIAFKNTGKTEGTWDINMAFEDSSWSKIGTPHSLTLNPGQTETLVWEGIVPVDAPIGSVARLVLYYDDSFKPLNWWIHVVPDAELCIKSSIVE